MRLFVIMVIASVIVTFILDEKNLFASFMKITVICMSIWIVIENAGAAGCLASRQQEYEVLQYKINSDFYINNEDRREELYNEIINYNKRIVVGRILKDNEWIGIFFADYYDELELIELS